MIDTSLFPYENFSVRLEIKTENKVAWFKDDIDLQKYLNRYRLDKRTINVNYRDGEPTKFSKTNKTNVQQTTGKSNHRSRSGSTGSTKSVDANRTSNRTRKSK